MTKKMTDIALRAAAGSNDVDAREFRELTRKYDAIAKEAADKKVADAWLAQIELAEECFDKGYLFACINYHETAVSYFERALEIDPEYSEAKIARKKSQMIIDFENEE